MFNCTKRRGRNYAKRIFEIRLKHVGVVLMKQMSVYGIWLKMELDLYIMVINSVLKFENIWSMQI